MHTAETRARELKKRQALRKKWIKENGPCADCGSWEDPQVDHIDPSKKVSHNVWSWSEERRLKELEKCQVLCVTCHRKKSALQQYGPRKHGTERMYWYGGCKCQPCKDAHAARKRNYLARVKKLRRRSEIG